VTTAPTPLLKHAPHIGFAETYSRDKVSVPPEESVMGEDSFSMAAPDVSDNGPHSSIEVLLTLSLTKVP